MLTLRLEIDARSSEGGETSLLVPVRSIRATQKADRTVDLLVTTESGEEGVYTIGVGLEHYSRAFAMNDVGQTVATYKPGTFPSISEGLQGGVAYATSERAGIVGGVAA